MRPDRQADRKQANHCQREDRRADDRRRSVKPSSQEREDATEDRGLERDQPNRPADPIGARHGGLAEPLVIDPWPTLREGVGIDGRQGSGTPPVEAETQVAPEIGVGLRREQQDASDCSPRHPDVRAQFDPVGGVPHRGRRRRGDAPVIRDGR